MPAQRNICPLTVAAKSLAKGGVELKRRDQPKPEIVAEVDLVARVQTEINALLDAIAVKVVDVPFK